MSDADNTGNWVLRTDMSDEFTGSTLNSDKWFVSGTDGIFMNHWPGRAPSQFAPENVRVENGKLHITTKWDPNYNFVSYTDPDCDCHYETYTTAAVISKNTFKYGYMEIMCKAADASITSSFWATGDNSELDVFEFVGNSKMREIDNIYRFTAHNKVLGISWHHQVKLDWRAAEGFHTYGCEWDPNGLKFYADGRLMRNVPKSEMGKVWCLTEQMKIWVDSETFRWEGFPEASELPIDYEIEYIRVWQKKAQ
jgi:beta-glucanase (GH16 family)